MKRATIFDGRAIRIKKVVFIYRWEIYVISMRCYSWSPVIIGVGANEYSIRYSPIQPDIGLRCKFYSCLLFHFLLIFQYTYNIYRASHFLQTAIYRCIFVLCVSECCCDNYWCIFQTLNWSIRTIQRISFFLELIASCTFTSYFLLLTFAQVYIT